MSKIKIYIPKDSSALSVGADLVAHELDRQAQAKGLDLEIIRNGSRGMLWLEPLLEVALEGGRVAYGPVTLDDLPSLFEAKFWEGGDHSLGLGLSEEIDFLKKQERLTFKRCGVIDPLNLDEYCEDGGFEGLSNALKMNCANVCHEVLKSGLRGRGGAGFPTGIKWETVLSAQSEQKYICCNADEGDSATFADRMMMEGDPFSIIEGMTIAAHGVGATQGYIYIRSEYPQAISVMNEAILRAREAGWLGQRIKASSLCFDMEVRKGAGAYICGEETSMLESLEGKRGEVRAKPPLPAIEGLFGQPTVVNNVLTLASLPIILKEGAEFYYSFGQGRSRGTQAFQLGGNIARGGLVEKAFGVTLHELVYDFGGGTRSGRALGAVQTGGPLGPYVTQDQFGLAMDYEELAQNGAMLGHGGLVVFDDSINFLEQARFAFEFCAIESCGKCTPCRIGSQRGLEALDQIIAGDQIEEKTILVKELCLLMKDGSMCAMGGMTPLPVESALKLHADNFLLQSSKPARQAPKPSRQD